MRLIQTYENLTVPLNDLRKVASGMSYFITQPVYSKEKIKQVYEETKHLNTPFFIGIMPIASYNNALFLHNEVPGIKCQKMYLTNLKLLKMIRKTKELSLRLSKELIDTVHEYFNGLYIITPFQKVDYSLELRHILNLLLLTRRQYYDNN